MTIDIFYDFDKMKILCLLASILVFVGCNDSVTDADTKEEGPPAEDSTPPEVSSVFPADGANSVSVSADLEVQFSEEVSNSNSSLSLQDSSDENVEGSLEVDGENMKFTPDDSLDHESTYTVSVKATDMSGNEMNSEHSWSFSTISEPDTQPFTVSSVSPEDQAEDVSVDVNAEVEFSEQVDESSISFNLKDGSDSDIQGSMEFESDKFTFTPDNSLEYSTDYTASVKATDMSGNEMEESFSWKFKTEQQPDNTQPSVASTTPGDGQRDVNISGPDSGFDIKIEMSEEVDPNSVNSDNIWIEKMDGQKIDPDFSVDGNTIVLKLSDADEDNDLLWPATQYRVHIEGLEDLVGNKMTGSYEWEFFSRSWTIKSDYVKSGSISDTYTTETSVYISGVFEKTNGFSSFFAAKFDSEGLLDWFNVLPGETESRGYGSRITFNEDRGELYLFSEKTKEVYFNRLDSKTGELLSEKHISDGSYEDMRYNPIMFDDSNNVYFFVRERSIGGGLVTNELQKTDTNGNLIDKLDFDDFDPSIATNGSVIMTSFDEYQGKQTAAKVDIQNMEFESLLVAEEGDKFPGNNSSVSMTKGSDKAYIIGEHEDEPVVVTVDVATGNNSLIEFGDVYDNVRGSTVSESGNVYVASERPDGANIVRVGDSGEDWRTSMTDPIFTSLSVSEEFGNVSVSKLFDNSVILVDSETGKKK